MSVEGGQAQTGQEGGGPHERVPAEPREAIVIGSGFGGAVAACRLQQAGFQVLILERGRRYEAKDFPALPVATELAPDTRRWTWQADQGLLDVVDLEELISVQAAGFGGGSLVYANVHLRPPMAAFDERWPDVYRQQATLEPYYDLAAYMLGAAPIDTHDELRGKIVKADQLDRAARKLDRKDAFFNPPLAITSVTGTNAHGKKQRACTGCGACITGCPETAKNTLDYNYLARAEQDGAEVRTQCEVVDIVEEGEGVWTVYCVDHLRAERRAFRTSHLFLCAGSVHSTRLLARAKLLREGTSGGASLAGVGYFPGGDAIGVIYDAEHPQHTHFGPTITTTLARFDPKDESSFFLIQDGGYARELDRMIGTLRAPAWVGRNRLTTSGKATICASKMPDPPRGPPDQDVVEVTPSLVDSLLDARKGGGLSAIASEQLRDAVPKFLTAAAEPLLFPAVVERTVDGAMRDRHARWFKGCPPDGPFLRLLRRFEWFVIRCFYGTSEQLAGRAFEAILSGSNLDRNELAKRVIGYDDARAERRTVLLAMGRDAASGVLHYDEKTDRLIADLDLYHLAPGYSRSEQLMSDIAKTLGGELRSSPAWAFLGKPITVHNQGGCRMSTDPKDGVTNECGQVHGRPGLYVMDGSVLCSPVGVNPSATITAIAERNIDVFIREHPKRTDRGGYERDKAGAAAWAAHAKREKWAIQPPAAAPLKDVPFQTPPVGLRFRESMAGHYFAGGADPGKHDAEYLHLESKGRPAQRAEVKLTASIENLAVFLEDEEHRMDLSGTITILLPGETKPYEGPVTGHLDLLSPRFKPYGLELGSPRLEAQRRIRGSRAPRVPDQSYRTVKGSPKRSEQRFMVYELRFVEKPGLALEGYKRVKDDPGLDAWRDTSTLFVKLRNDEARTVLGAGAIHVALDEFLYKQLPSIEVTGTDDPERITWAMARFATFFFGTLQRIYMPGVQTALDALFRGSPNNVRREPHGQAD